MPRSLREQRREKFAELVEGSGLTRVEAAALLYQSVHAINAWLKPESSKSSNLCPMWAIELFALKTDQKVSAKALKALEGTR